MSDNSLQQIIDDYCKTNGFNAPDIQVNDEDNQFTCTIIVNQGNNGEVERSAFGDTKVEAMNKAFKRFIEDVVNRPPVVVPNNPLTDSLNIAQNNEISSTQSMSINAESLPNPIGSLNEKCQKKGWTFPDYKSEQSGPSHCPVFTTYCTLDTKGQIITGVGKGNSKQDSKKLSARHVFTQLAQKEEMEEKQRISLLVNSSAKNPELFYSYFKRFQNMSQDLEDIIVDNNSNYSQKLEKMVFLLGCDLSYEEKDLVVLKVSIKDVDSLLLVTFGKSRNTAAKKAVLTIKILLTEE